MRISIKLVGMLIDQIPAGGPLGARPQGAKPLDLPAACTLADLLNIVGLKADVEYFAMINDEHIPAERLAAHVLREADSVVLFPPLKGG
jgi:sulfur carrier protein ThiS